VAADACAPSKNSGDGVTGVGVALAGLRAAAVGETADERTRLRLGPRGHCRRRSSPCRGLSDDRRLGPRMRREPPLSVPRSDGGVRGGRTPEMNEPEGLHTHPPPPATTPRHTDRAKAAVPNRLGRGDVLS